MVFKYVILILRKDKYILGRIGLYFFGIWGEAKLFLGIWGAKANTFRETRTLFAERRGHQCIIFRDQGSTDPPPPVWPHLIKNLLSKILEVESSPTQDYSSITGIFYIN